MKKLTALLTLLTVFMFSFSAGAVEKLYGQIGRAFLGEHADAIRRYLESKPKGKFGSHRYDPEDWGFSPEEIREKTKAYVEAYGVELEE